MSSLPNQSKLTTAPETVARIANLMSTFPHDWFLCGGWAVDAWLGRVTRGHEDIDISVFEEDQRAIFDHLSADWHLVAHDPNVRGDTREPWNGRKVDLPAHIHATAGDGLKLEILVNKRTSGDWVLRDEPRVARSLAACVAPSPWGLPATVPSVLMFYKATIYWGVTDIRPRTMDEGDFLALLPHLDKGEHQWLTGAISTATPNHPWLAHITR